MRFLLVAVTFTAATVTYKIVRNARFNAYQRGLLNGLANLAERHKIGEAG